MIARSSFLSAMFAVLIASSGAALAKDKPAGLIHELKFGVLAHDVGDLWSGFNREDGIDINVEASLSPSLDLGWVTLRPAIGASINTEGDTSKIYVDARLEHDFESGVFLAAGIGAAVHDGEIHGDREHKALGSRVLLHFPLEAGYRFDEHHGLSVYFDHVSNGYLADDNEGMDTLGLRYGYRF